MKNFKEIKTIIIEKAKIGQACTEEFKKAVKSKNYKELLKVMFDNSNWCFRNGIFSDEILSNIPLKTLNESRIYYDQKDLSFSEGKNLFYGSSTSKHYGSSTSKHYGSSISEHYGSSFANVYELKEAVKDNVIIMERSTGIVHVNTNVKVKIHSL